MGVLTVLAIPFGFFSAIYVVLASLFLAGAYGRQPRSRRRELVVWVTSWLGAVPPVTLFVPGWATPIYAAVYLLPAYVAWQLLALAVWQGMAWVSSRPGPLDVHKSPDAR